MATHDLSTTGLITPIGQASLFLTGADVPGWKWNIVPEDLGFDELGENYQRRYIRPTDSPTSYDVSNGSRVHYGNSSLWISGTASSTPFNSYRTAISINTFYQNPSVFATNIFSNGDVIGSHTIRTGLNGSCSYALIDGWKVTLESKDTTTQHDELFLHYDKSGGSSGYIDLGVYLPYTQTQRTLVFGTGESNVYAWYGDGTASKSHLMKVDLSDDSVSTLYSGTTFGSAILGGQNHVVRLSDTSDIFHLYNIDGDTTKLWKFDASTDTLTTHSSSPFTHTDKADYGEAGVTHVQRYFTLDHGTTKEIRFHTSQTSTLGYVFRFRYTTSADSITFTATEIEEALHVSRKYWVGGITRDPDSMTLDETCSSIELKEYGSSDTVAYMCLWKIFRDTTPGYDRTRIYVNYACITRSDSAYSWSGWIFCHLENSDSYLVDEGFTMVGIASAQGQYFATKNQTWTQLQLQAYDAGRTTYYSAGLRCFEEFQSIKYMSASGTITPRGSATLQLTATLEIADGLIAMMGSAFGGLLQFLQSTGDMTVRGEAFLRVAIRRVLNQLWSVGDYRIEDHQEYIHGTDGYNHNLATVNAHRAAQVPALPPYLSLLTPTAPPMSDEYVQQILHQNIKHDTVYWHHDPSFDYGYQDKSQKLALMQGDGVVDFAENLLNLPSYEDPKYFTAVDNLPVPYTAEDLSQDSFDAWLGSPDHNANMLYDYGTTEIYFGYAAEWSTQLTITSGYNATWTGQQFYNFTLPTSGLNEMERTWTNEYQIEGAQLIEFYGQYAISTWIDARTSIGLPYAIKVSSQISFNYAARTSSQISFPTHYTVTGQVGLPYTSLEPIASQYGFLYDLKPASAAKQIAFPYATKLAKTITLQYGDALQSISKLEMPYSLLTYVADQTSFPYEGVSPIASQHSFNYSLLVNNPVTSSMTFWYTLMDEQIVSSIDDVAVVVNGTVIKVESANVSLAEGDFLWKSELTLSNQADYNSFVQDDPFKVVIGTDEYEMVVDEKSIDRGENTNARVSMRIIGLSPAVKFKEPRTSPIDFDLETAAMAKEVVESILGETVEWSVLNWQIPPHRLTATDISPSRLVSQIVEVVGAVLESKKNGTLKVRYKWEINTNEYHLATPDQIYTDTQDNLSASEQTRPFELYNKFRIREGSDIFSDKIEFFNNDEVDGNDLAGILRVYPNPWRLTVRVIQTNGPEITLNHTGVVQRQETELIEFKEGIASVAYPIVSIDIVDWRSYNLGPLVNELHGTEITAPTDINYGYGLAEVTYTTESIEYTTSAPPTDAQFLVEDIA